MTTGSASEKGGNSAQDVVLALGGLVVNVAALEEALHDAIFLLAGGENQAIGVLTAGLPFRTLVDKFGALCAGLEVQRPPSKSVIEYCAHLNTLNEQRNSLIHSGWNLRDARRGHRRFKRTAKAKTGFKLNPTAVKAEDVHLLSDQFREAEKKLWEFVP